MNVFDQDLIIQQFIPSENMETLISIQVSKGLQLEIVNYQVWYLSFIQIKGTLDVFSK